jgi:hypothetical protein
MKANRFREYPTALNLSIEMPQGTLPYVLLISRNKAETVFHYSNTLIISVDVIARLSVQILYRRNPYCVSENFLFFSNYKGMRMFVIRPNTLHTYGAMNISLPSVLSIYE